MSFPIEFFVPGQARPAGSKRAFALRRRDGSFITRANGSPIINVVDDSGKDGTNWRSDVKRFARDAYDGPPLTGPLRLRLQFIFARPKGHFGTGRNAGVLKDSAPDFPTGAPDATKVTRAVEDALNGLAWHDDAQIVRQEIAKDYGKTPGVIVRIDPVGRASVEERASTPANSLFEEVL